MWCDVITEKEGRHPRLSWATKQYEASMESTMLWRYDIPTDPIPLGFQYDWRVFLYQSKHCDWPWSRIQIHLESPGPPKRWVSPITVGNGWNISLNPGGFPGPQPATSLHPLGLPGPQDVSQPFVGQIVHTSTLVSDQLLQIFVGFFYGFWQWEPNINKNDELEHAILLFENTVDLHNCSWI